ncbi:unnamed protein product, partial [Gongylonema pulchrum]|uniref:Expressed conserved protein n=1 Tax=Gongylonema pulchrum TaxID=637853 RepID=A0A183D0U0_9BILA
MELASVSSITTSDSDFCQPPIPIARGANRNWISRPTLNRLRRNQGPSKAETRSHYASMYAMMAPNDCSSSFEAETTNEEDDDLEFADRNHRSHAPLIRGLSMIEELSPIVDSSDEMIPKVPSLQLTRNWHPLATSTTTSMHQVGLPKTNPHHSKMIATSTPTSSAAAIGMRYRGPLSNVYNNDNNNSYDALERPESFFENTPRLEWSRPQSKILSTAGGFPNTNWKSDHFGLPAPFARRIGCKGKLQLTMSVSGCLLTVSVVQA